ncbi:hypothetical protein, partial [Blastomonas sp. CCH5-E3]|uniref:hypothetical protein n=1 Tax=Blastomonas sp. CCH5-E3 TaxID=1768750 RepID=UPI000A7B34F0
MTMRWIVPFKGRNNTGVYNQNFVWNDGHLYVMDNHRAAAWCWAQRDCQDFRVWPGIMGNKES